MMIQTLLIANRGEIAVRIIRAASELGIKTVQVYSAADEDSLAVKMADIAVNIGPPQAAKSYLNVEAILEVAKKHHVDAIHPAYGFLAENAGFADAVHRAGMIFIGPDGDIIRQMGDKAAARIIAKKANIPTVPGSHGQIDIMAQASEIAKTIGFPVMVKAVAGGGGRGIRIIHSLEEFDRLVPQAKAEARAAFGDAGLYIEKFIAKARHIEVQILGDGVDVIHLFERECSLQRRRQKIWEEAPCVILPQDLRMKLCNAAVCLAKSVNYKGAGTVEFLYDDETCDFYFIEMNTRIQVEHPVSEMITGIDIVQEMIKIASGKKLSFTQNEVNINGHAIEIRVNVEDPANNFMPSLGVISELDLPNGPGIRFDGMIYNGYSIQPFYDSMVGKLIVWQRNRPATIARLKRALNEFYIQGVITTIPLFQALVNEIDICNNDINTQWLESWLENNFNNETKKEND